MKRHTLELFSLISGAAFLAYAAAYLVLGADNAPSAGVTIPLLLVALGAGGLAGVLVAQRRADQSAAEEPKPLDEY